ncbi:MAG: type II toxin-antitoxin system PemK/MazF family toxin [Anaerolineae bacterium]
MMSYKRGDVILVHFPFTNRTTLKKRPALVVQADGLNTDLSNINLILVPITSNLQRAQYQARVKVLMIDPISKGSGLIQDSVILADNLTTLELKFVIKKIGAIPDMTLIDKALRVALAL